MKRPVLSVKHPLAVVVWILYEHMTGGWSYSSGLGYKAALQLLQGQIGVVTAISMAG